MRFISSIFLMIWSCSGFSGVLSLDAANGDHLKIEAPHAKISFKEATGSKIIVNFKGDSSFFGGVSLKRYGSKIVLKTSSGFKENAPKVELSVSAPAMSAFVNIGKGELKVSGWTGDLTVVGSKAQFNINSTKGKLSLSLQNGQIKVGQHVGELKIDAYKASTQISKLTGELNLESFSGTVELAQHKGGANVLLHKGAFNVAKSFGAYGFKSEKAQINLKSHKGELKGRLGAGSMSARLIGTQNVQINTKAAPVTLKVASTGARADIGTLEGYLTLPRQLARARVGSMTVSKGKMSGSDGGTVYVRTESGNIKLY